MPVANLDSYQTVAVRVRATAPGLRRLAGGLKQQLDARLAQQCTGFQEVPPDAQGVDMMVDLNLTAANRGGTGPIRNMSQENVETLLVLSDGSTGELLGTSRIHGQSSGLQQGIGSPEAEAVGVVAKAVADVLVTSGCTGPRKPKPPLPVVATNPPSGGSDGGTTTGPGPGPGPTPPPGPGSSAPPPAPTPDPQVLAKAEALNDSGKDKLRSADVPGALADFQQATTVLADARYEFNVCLAFEAEQSWNDAIGACKQAQGMSPKAELVVKINARLDLLQHHQ
jgi:hypothetical protein